MDISADKFQQHIQTLLVITHPLAESHPEAPEENVFIRVLEGTFRRNTYTLQAIAKLAETPHLADSALTLTRKMIEDVVTIEYILHKNKEERAEKFYDFMTIQAARELKIMNKLGYLNQDQLQEFSGIFQKYNEIKSDFMNEGGQVWYSPFGIGVEQMLDKLQGEVFSEKDRRRTQLAYLKGSSKVHLTPGDIMGFMTDDLRNESSQEALIQSLVLATTSFIRLTTRYIDKIRAIQQEDVYPEIAQEVKRIWETLDQ